MTLKWIQNSLEQYIFLKILYLLFVNNFDKTNAIR